MTEPALLFRSVPFELVRAADQAAGDGLTLEGYAAVFDTPTRINSWEGMFDEQIARGAFKKSIRETTPVLQFDHGRHPMVGSIPLGSIETLREDAQGLFVKAQLHDNWLVKPVRDAIASGSVDGMSFRFGVVKDEWRDAKGNLITDPAELERLIWASDPKNVPLRTLREVKVPELGPVVFPAYASTSVGVRSQELASALADPEVRADLARLLLLGTPPSAPDEPRGSDADTGAAAPPEPLAQHSVDPSLLALASAFDTREVI